MVKIGIIGLGHMGGYHASISLSLPKIHVVGVADQNKENLKKITNPMVFVTTDFHDWIDKVEAVIIAVPTMQHYTIAKECLLLGKHVLIEKPITKNLTEAEELFAIAQNKNVALHVGHVERFNGAIQEVKKLVTQPLLIECHRMGPFVSRVQNDSVVLDLMIHDIDLILSLTNSKLKTLSAQGNKIMSNSWDIATAQLTFENGTIASITSSRCSQIKKRSMAIHQPNSYVSLDFTTQDLLVYKHTNSSIQVGDDQVQYRQESLVEHVFVYKDNPLKQEIMYFIQSIKNNTNFTNPAQDLPALQITLDIEKKLAAK